MKGRRGRSNIGTAKSQTYLIFLESLNSYFTVSSSGCKLSKQSKSFLLLTVLFKVPAAWLKQHQKHVSPVPGSCSDSLPAARGEVCSGAPGIAPHLGARVPKSVLVLCQLDRTEAARGRERQADGISGTGGKQEMFLVGEDCQSRWWGRRGNLQKRQTNNVKRGRIKRRNATGSEIPPEAGRFQARRRRPPV